MTWITNVKSCDWAGNLKKWGSTADFIESWFNCGMEHDQNNPVCTMANAGYSAEEIAANLSNPADHIIPCPVSINYVYIHLRAFRMEILRQFFNDYPAAIWIKDWRIIAKAVSIYTTSKENKLCWEPKRGAIIDARQKIDLLEFVYRYRDVSYNPNTQFLSWRIGNKVHRKKIVPLGNEYECVYFSRGQNPQATIVLKQSKQKEKVA